MRESADLNREGLVVRMWCGNKTKKITENKYNYMNYMIKSMTVVIDLI